MTKEIWRANIFVDEGHDYGYHTIKVESPTLEGLLAELSKQLPKYHEGFDTSGICDEDSIVEHVIVLDEMSVDKAVDYIKTKNFYNLEVKQKMDTYHDLKVQREKLSTERYKSEGQIRVLQRKVDEDERAIGNHVIENRPDSSDYQQIVQRCTQTKKLLEEQQNKEAALAKEYQAISAKENEARKSLGL